MSLAIYMSLGDWACLGLGRVSVDWSLIEHVRDLVTGVGEFGSCGAFWRLVFVSQIGNYLFARGPCTYLQFMLIIYLQIIRDLHIMKPFSSKQHAARLPEGGMSIPSVTLNAFGFWSGSN